MPMHLPLFFRNDNAIQQWHKKDIETVREFNPKLMGLGTRKLYHFKLYFDLENIEEVNRAVDALTEWNGKVKLLYYEL